MTNMGCSDGNCQLRLSPIVGMHTNAGCRCLRDVPVGLEIAISRKLQAQETEIKRLEVWQRLAVQLWHIGTPDPDDDIDHRAFVDFLAKADAQLEAEQARCAGVSVEETEVAKP